MWAEKSVRLAKYFQRKVFSERCFLKGERNLRVCNREFDGNFDIKYSLSWKMQLSRKRDTSENDCNLAKQ